MFKKKTRMEKAAITIGSAMGKADRTAHDTAHRVAKAAHVAKKELHDITKELDALKRQLAKSNKRLMKALQ